MTSQRLALRKCCLSLPIGPRCKYLPEADIPRLVNVLFFYDIDVVF